MVMQICPGGEEAHDAHMEINGECPWCYKYDPDQTEFGSIGEDGTIYSADGSIIESHAG